ncbi:hypothetical protein CKAH01_00602 [Colletotrichum kahawae]|uniref:Uncharacterized protein n=1 Tax=Colletotrichum kahawae TaxID=34407 RepID=A0AAD9YLN0_COLKA|nr:hypothetical protein CKAH01_00602 [Colletotrichum kahawae]
MVPPSGSRCCCCCPGWLSFPQYLPNCWRVKATAYTHPSTPLIPNISEQAERLPGNAVQTGTLLVGSLAHGRRRESIAPIAHRQARCRQEGAYLTAAAGFGTASPSPATMLHLSPNSPLTLVHSIG